MPYDNAGNILARAEYAYTTGALGTAANTVSYGYTDTNWKDKLTAYDGDAITYDEIGNPLTYGNKSFTWEHGRELATLSDGTTTWTYTYDANGMRTKRTDGNAVYTYEYNGDQLVHLTVDAQEYFDLHFTYDASGTPLTITESGVTYYYVTNLQGDVIGIIDQSGVQIASYTYDAWGNVLTHTNTQLADYNPLRYRGYVYDTETGLYYLQSRYYDSGIGRFINADSLLTTGYCLIGNNLYVYCGSNPVCRIDPTGHSWLDAVEAFLFALAETIAPGSRSRAEQVENDPNAYNIINWLTLGFADTVKGAIAPEEPLSLQHWTDSIAVVGTAYCAYLGIASHIRTPTASSYVSRGSTGRTIANNLNEQLAMQQVMSDPLSGAVQLPITMTDPRWPASEGWVKMAYNVNGIEIHFVYNTVLQIFDDFKFK